ncbi:hypothetical protein VPH35_131481 [Triticum aestivum]|uniref:uncharacterized protein n=1 Tax=Triticum aestivum TaxID=4565 RepID=UPI001D02733B|nr:uncharacterized protein LOC123163043 [Triticum aestivum]
MEDVGFEFLVDVVDRFPFRQDFADSLNLPDPVPLAVLPRIAASAEPAEWNAVYWCGQRIGGARQGRPQDDGRQRREASPTRSAESTDRVNLEGLDGQKGYVLGVRRRTEHVSI